MPHEGIIAIECELAAYRKGSIFVRLDLQQGCLTWRESRQWCNNFIRSLTEDQVGEFRRMLRDTGLLDCAGRLPAEAAVPAGPDGSARKTTLQLTVFWPDRQLMLTGEDLDQSAFKALGKAIEKLSRVPFRL